MSDEAFTKEIDLLCKTYAIVEPDWVERMRENPVVWAPHKPYFNHEQSAVPACCEFGVIHPIHTIKPIVLESGAQ